MQNILIVKSCDFVYSPMFSCEDVDPAYQQAFIKPNFYFVDDSKLNLKIDISVGKNKTDYDFNMLINYEVDLDECYSTSKKPKHEIVKEIMKEFDILDGCRTLVEQQIEISKKLNLHLKNNIKNTRVKNLLKGGH